MNDIIVDFVNISSSYPSSSREWLPILLILNSFCFVPAFVRYPVVLFGPFSHLSLQQGSTFSVKGLTMSVTTQLCHCRANAALNDDKRMGAARFRDPWPKKHCKSYLLHHASLLSAFSSRHSLPVPGLKAPAMPWFPLQRVVFIRKYSSGVLGFRCMFCWVSRSPWGSMRVGPSQLCIPETVHSQLTRILPHGEAFPVTTSPCVRVLPCCSRWHFLSTSYEPDPARCFLCIRLYNPQAHPKGAATITSVLISVPPRRKHMGVGDEGPVGGRIARRWQT